MTDVRPVLEVERERDCFLPRRRVKLNGERIVSYWHTAVDEGWLIALKISGEGAALAQLGRVVVVTRVALSHREIAAVLVGNAPLCFVPQATSTVK